jgi:hypothetical protein
MSLSRTRWEEQKDNAGVRLNTAPIPGLCSILPWRFAAKHGTMAGKGICASMARPPPRILKPVSFIGTLFNCESSHDLSRRQN